MNRFFEEGFLKSGNMTYAKGGEHDLSGCTAEGVWSAQRVLHGNCKTTYPNGEIHEGIFENGFIKSGKFAFADGRIHEGLFGEGGLKGRIAQGNGVVAEGFFEHGGLQVGKITHPDGTVRIVKK